MARVVFPEGRIPPPEPETAIARVARELYYVTPTYVRESDVYLRTEWEAVDEFTRARMVALATTAVDARLGTLAGAARL